MSSEPCWIPRTFTERTAQLTKHISQFALQTTTLQMAKETDSNMTAILQLMTEMKAENRKAAQRKEEREE